MCLHYEHIFRVDHNIVSTYYFDNFYYQKQYPDKTFTIQIRS